jgi:hypothetical protein
MHVAKYTIVDVMAVSNANLYVVLARSSGYFRVWQEDADCLIPAPGSSLRVNIMAGHSKMCVDDEVLNEQLQENENIVYFWELI